MEPQPKPTKRGDPSDSEHARFWGEPAEDRQLEFDEK